MLGFSRQAFYKEQHRHEIRAYQSELLFMEINSIRDLQPRLGARKLLIKLEPFMKDHGIKLGRDGFFCWLKQNNLLVRKRKRTKPITTDSWHWFHKYKNLIKGFIPKAFNQLWVSDITYISVSNYYAYLSLITDAYSRQIVGFYLSKTLEAKGSIMALQMALGDYNELPGLIHHSDRGVQYCCNEYVKILTDYKIKISMTEKGDPLENAIAERVNGILKSELLELNYNDFEEAEHAVMIAINTYNYQRPHSSIEYLTPMQAQARTGVLKRKWKNYYSSTKKEVIS